ncbi:MAG: 3-phosphoglycerate dehydrogenase, partial [Caldisericia bacterium]|nr:3-phosphoglycerate dehydrogenase [Caldisericia bacterium]
MYKILIADEISQAGLQILKNHPEFEVVEKTKITGDELKEEIKNYNALVVRSRTKVTEEIINNAENLKLIVRGGVGIDNIDKSAAERKGIAVKNTPKASSISVAELAFGMMLSGVRRLVDATLSMKEGKWEKKKFEGFELAGKTLGILGYGNIGRSLAERAIAFCMNVLVYDPYVKEINIKGVTLTDLNTLLTSSDIISIHCPKTNETCNLINKETLAKMKDGV